MFLAVTSLSLFAHNIANLSTFNTLKMTTQVPTTHGICQCHNPYEGSLQSWAHTPIRKCRTTGQCFVPSSSTCEDVRADTGFAGAGKFVSAEACHQKGGTTTLKPIVVDLQGNNINQECTGSLCKQTNHINVVLQNIDVVGLLAQGPGALLV